MDIIAVFTDQDDYSKTCNYWKYLKAKLKKENSQVVSANTQLKFLAPDGKRPFADMLDYKGIIALGKESPGKNQTGLLNGLHTVMRVLTEKVKQLIISFYRKVNPNIRLIEGQRPENQYKASNRGNIFRKHLARVSKDNPFTLHCLLHRYVNHLPNMGIDLRIIQELSGHNSFRATKIYTHFADLAFAKINHPTHRK